MKFQVRDGYVAHIINRVDLGDGSFQNQEINFYGGQVCDLTAEQAEAHAHKLEPKDKAAEAYLAAKVLPSTAPAAAAGAVDLPAIIAATVQATLAAQAAAAAAAEAQAPAKP